MEEKSTKELWKELSELLEAAGEQRLWLCLPEDPRLTIHCTCGSYTPRALLLRACRLSAALQTAGEQ